LAPLVECGIKGGGEKNFSIRPYKIFFAFDGMPVLMLIRAVLLLFG
jgi:hypothetical protein